MLYVVTLAPTIYNRFGRIDTAAATGGIIRATGYPLRQHPRLADGAIARR